MAKKIHLDNLMRARLRKMVDAAMPEYNAVQERNIRLEKLLLRVLALPAGSIPADLAEDISRAVTETP